MAKKTKIVKEKSIEDKIWDSANKLRGNLTASEYQNVVLGLTFLHRHWTPADYPGDSGNLGVNLGVGAQYDITSNIYANYELKYQYVNDHDRANMCVGIGFRF